MSTPWSSSTFNNARVWEREMHVLKTIVCKLPKFRRTHDKHSWSAEIWWSLVHSDVQQSCFRTYIVHHSRLFPFARWVDLHVGFKKRDVQRCEGWCHDPKLHIINRIRSKHLTPHGMGFATSCLPPIAAINITNSHIRFQ
jgi:hypothetical protein